MSKHGVIKQRIAFGVYGPIFNLNMTLIYSLCQACKYLNCMLNSRPPGNSHVELNCVG
jgi:hypothetical protein